MDDINTPEIQLLEILKSIWVGKYLIMILMIIGSLLGYLFATHTAVTLYQTSSTLVINKDSLTHLHEDAYTDQDLSMYGKILNTYVAISNSSTVLSKVASKVAPYTTQDIQHMVTISAVADTFLLQVSVEGENPNDITQITNLYVDAIIEECYRIMPIGTLTVVDPAISPTTPLASDIKPTIMIGCLVGSLLGIFIVRIRVLISRTKVMSPTQINTYLDLETWALPKQKSKSNFKNFNP